MIPSTPPSSSSSSDALAAAFEVDDDDALDDAVDGEREVRRSNDDDDEDDDGEDFRASTLPTAVIVLRLPPPRKPSTVAIAALINAAPRATLPKAMMRIIVRRDDQCVHVASAHRRKLASKWREMRDVPTEKRRNLPCTTYLGIIHATGGINCS